MWLLALLACRIEVGPPPVVGGDCASDVPSGEVWIYTSVYQSVLDELEPALRAALPGVEPRFLQSGSEKVAQRFEAEVSAGGSPACVLWTSDPVWYVALAEQDRLRPHLAPDVLKIDRAWVDPEGRWTASRVSLMVTGVQEGGEKPAGFADLADPRFRDRVSMPDPLASGTAFTWLAFATHDGWSTVDTLRANGIVAAGGNSAVQARIETGERPVGILLLENILAARRKGSPIEAVFPSDGAVAVPGPVAIPAGCPNPRAAEAVVDWLLAEEAQTLIARGDMYPVLPGVPPPPGAPPLDTIAVRPWTAEILADTVKRQAEIKSRWASP